MGGVPENAGVVNGSGARSWRADNTPVAPTPLGTAHYEHRHETVADRRAHPHYRLSRLEYDHAVGAGAFRTPGAGDSRRAPLARPTARIVVDELVS